MTTNSFLVALPGAHADTLMWADPAEIEPAALDQLRNISRLPWVAKVRVMPDVHLGKGATVGSVIAMRDAVSPSAVGVDIGCLDADTEFLSPNGWVRMDSWNGEQVLGYDPATDLATFAQPQQYIIKECSEFYHFKNSKGLDQMLSPDHRVLVWSGHKNRGLVHRVLSPAELSALNLEKGYRRPRTWYSV